MYPASYPNCPELVTKLGAFFVMYSYGTPIPNCVVAHKDIVCGQLSNHFFWGYKRRHWDSAEETVKTETMAFVVH